MVEYRGRQAIAVGRGVDDAYAATVPVADCIAAGEYRVRLGDLDELVFGRGLAYELGIRSLGESDGILYALRRTGFSSLLPMEGYTRRRAGVAGIYAADAETDSLPVKIYAKLTAPVVGRHADKCSGVAVSLHPAVSQGDKIGVFLHRFSHP